MEPVDPATNPFALITNPQAVLDAVQHSTRLARLQSRVYRPLDQSEMHPGSPADELRAVVRRPGDPIG